MADVDCVDVSGLWSDDLTEQAATDKAIWQALLDTGGMVLTGFPDAEKIDGWALAGHEFFAAPDDIRQPLEIGLSRPDNANLYRGYHPITGTHFNNSYLDFGPEAPSDAPDLPGISILTEATPWPEIPGYKANIRACYTALNALAQKLMRSIGRSAGFDPADIAARFDGEHSTLRFLDYPMGDASENDGIAAHCHVDASGLSLLWQGQPGLQAQGPDGVFYDVPMRENCISLHVGTVMNGLTGGVVPATPHQVLASDGPRKSMGFFLEPKLNAPLTPADKPVAETGVEDTYGYLLLKTLHGREKYKDVVPDPAAG